MPAIVPTSSSSSSSSSSSYEPPIEHANYTCALRVTNSVIEKAVVTSTDSYKLLYSQQSIIKGCDLTFEFVDQDYNNLEETPIQVYSTEMDIITLNASGLDNDVYPLVFSSDHSKIFIRDLIHSFVSLPYGSPDWTPFDATYPTYGNIMSYNIAELDTSGSSSSSGG